MENKKIDGIYFLAGFLLLGFIMYMVSFHDERANNKVLKNKIDSLTLIINKNDSISR